MREIVPTGRECSERFLEPSPASVLVEGLIRVELVTERMCSPIWTVTLNRVQFSAYEHRQRIAGQVAALSIRPALGQMRKVGGAQRLTRQRPRVV